MLSFLEMFLLGLVALMIALYVTKKSTSGSSKTIDISNVSSTISDAVNNGSVYVYTVTVSFDSSYLTSENLGSTFAYFSSSLDNVAVSSINQGYISEDGNGYQIQFTCTQIDGVFQGVQSFDAYFTLFNDDTADKSEYQTVALGPIQCIFEQTRIKTAQGLKRASDIGVGDALLQPQGGVSRVNKITKTLIPKYVPTKNTTVATMNDSRLFQYNNTIITYWHKVKLGAEMVLPCDHPQFRELINSGLEGRAYVYNFKLDTISDLIITEDDAILESLYPHLG
jgi:hypothetical protein